MGLCPSDTVLLCSDGLVKELNEEAICSILSHNYSPAIMAQDLVARGT